MARSLRQYSLTLNCFVLPNTDSYISGQEHSYVPVKGPAHSDNRISKSKLSEMVKALEQAGFKKIP